MAVSETEIVELIVKSIPDADVRIEDLRGDGDHYAAHVTSAVFKGKTRVQQHKMVNDALKEILGGKLHALAIQTAVA